MKAKVFLFGDAPITPDEHVVVIEHEYMGERHITVCDFTECGMYVANKTIKWCKERGISYKARETTIRNLVKELPDDLPVDAWNNGKAIWLRDRKVRTIGDLRRALRIMAATCLDCGRTYWIEGWDVDFVYGLCPECARKEGWDVDDRIIGPRHYLAKREGER